MNLKINHIPIINKKARPGKKIIDFRAIVLHNPGLVTTDEAISAYFANKNEYVSAHDAIDQDSVTEIIPMDEVAYHCSGPTVGNYTPYAKQKLNTNNKGVYRYTHSIEVCTSTANGMFYWDAVKLLKERIKMVCDYWGKEVRQVPIVRHYDITGKECPYYYIFNPVNWFHLLDFLYSY